MFNPDEHTTSQSSNCTSNSSTDTPTRQLLLQQQIQQSNPAWQVHQIQIIQQQIQQQHQIQQLFHPGFNQSGLNNQIQQYNSNAIHYNQQLLNQHLINSLPNNNILARSSIPLSSTDISISYNGLQDAQSSSSSTILPDISTSSSSSSAAVDKKAIRYAVINKTTSPNDLALNRLPKIKKRRPGQVWKGRACSCGYRTCGYIKSGRFELFNQAAYIEISSSKVVESTIECLSFVNDEDEDDDVEMEEEDEEDIKPDIITSSITQKTDKSTNKQQTNKSISVHLHHYRIEDRPYVKKRGQGRLYNKDGDIVLPSLSPLEQMEELYKLKIIKKYNSESFAVISDDLIGKGDGTLTTDKLDELFEASDKKFAAATAKAEVSAVSMDEVLVKEEVVSADDISADKVEVAAEETVSADDVLSTDKVVSAAEEIVSADDVVSAEVVLSADKELIADKVIIPPTEKVIKEEEVLVTTDEDDKQSNLRGSKGKYFQSSLILSLPQDEDLPMPTVDEKQLLSSYIQEEYVEQEIQPSHYEADVDASIWSRKKKRRPEKHTGNGMELVKVSADPKKLIYTLIPCNEGTPSGISKKQIISKGLPKDELLYLNMERVTNTTDIWKIKEKGTDREFYFNTETNLYYYRPIDFDIDEKKAQDIINICSRYNPNVIPVALLFLMRYYSKVELKRKKDKALVKLFKLKMLENNNQSKFDQAKDETIAYLRTLQEKFIQNVDMITLDDLLRLIWHTWNLWADEFDRLHNEQDANSREATRSGADTSSMKEEDIKKMIWKNKLVHYCWIMLHSQGSKDKATFENYIKLAKNIADVDAGLRIFKGREFTDAYKILSMEVFKNGMNSQKAEAHLSMLLISAIEYNYGMPEDDELLKGFYQFGEKKVTIAGNEMKAEDSEVVNVGKDSHVQKTMRVILRRHFPDANKSDIDMMVDMLCRELPSDVAWWTNEILGQMGQFLQKKGTVGETFALKVFGNILIAYPGKYNDIIKAVTKLEQWRRLNPEEEKIKADEVKSNEPRRSKRTKSQSNN